MPGIVVAFKRERSAETRGRFYEPKQYRRVTAAALSLCTRVLLVFRIFRKSIRVFLLRFFEGLYGATEKAADACRPGYKNKLFSPA